MNWLFNNPYGRLTFSFTPTILFILLFSFWGWTVFHIFLACFLFIVGIINEGFLLGVWHNDKTNGQTPKTH